jgi:hypothetical protein
MSDQPRPAETPEPEELDEEEGHIPLPEDASDMEDAEDEMIPDSLDFCELCGSTDDEDEELLRCEECGRLHCSQCREYDEDGTPYCSECSDELNEA